MRSLWVIILMFIASQATIAQQTNCDSIIWNATRKLNWSDYRARPVAATRVSASTHFSFVHTWRITDGVFIARVVCIFEPCVSWAKPGGSVELLAHEQGHFDIAEFFRRSYNKRVSQLTGTPQAIQRAEELIYTNIRRDCDHLQLTYDTDTNHGLIPDKQAKWLTAIQTMLDSISQYDMEEVRLTL